MSADAKRVAGELGALLPEPHGPALPDDRHRLLKEHLMNEIHQAQVQAQKAPQDARPRRRRAWYVVPVGMAAAGALAFTFLAGPGRSGGDDGFHLSAAPVVKVEVGSANGVGALMENVAERASQAPANRVGPNQFVYVRSHYSNMQAVDGSPFKLKTYYRESWTSQNPDKVQSRLKQPGDDLIWSAPRSEDHAQDNRNHTYAALQKLPTEPGALLKKLRADAAYSGSSDQNLFDYVGGLISESILPPETGAALYRAAARIPGVVALDKAQDGDGRPGVALARTDERTHERRELVFDANSYDYLGMRAYLVRNTELGKKGTVTEMQAVLDRDVVNSRDETPKK
ncbi:MULTISPECIES: CU044_5270 family protein [unclassified Streptomyces]|uniref:CU044_5270 family protein n=1 Tax=unclassified Streptomyces TaxID=2593676 RepID=UPI00225BECB1|nr:MULTISPECIES: CU044_5270 family protein [unclassified Streptomyces]WSP56784.1 CU044_5270 family protein [Streptomyces sp. NBC_01241]WSU22498.1 CU044_5270 family protein [Streptomyces sp. NBC_01108]MCX4788543.1 CU044_5270 family protein [Streptomyces sp. NBC_01221]MCX4795697.1 CU044_5270 family protein [Streptomyces sp. NBC_01242]WSJ36989.1 CU044_5270 family protein [Streptomyces sp. NBC_01321]